MTSAVNPHVLANLSTVAKAMTSFDLDRFVFVGGAVVGLLITDTAAAEARATQDIDVVTPDLNKAAFTKLEAELRAAGFTPDAEVICRWRISGVTVDIMPPDGSVLGFSNIWYKTMLAHAEMLKLPSGEKIKVASAPYMLATKLEAFKSRGEEDYLASHDVEDVIILLDGRPEIVQEVLDADDAVRAYIKTEFETLLGTSAFVDAVEAHLPDPATSYERAEYVRRQMRRITGGEP